MGAKTNIDPDEIKYMEWLHTLTHLGYAQEVVFMTDSSDLVQLLYDEGKTPAEALRDFMELRGIKKINL